MAYTNFYIRFGLGHGFDPEHPVWREYLAGLGEATDGREWTYRFYRQRPPVTPPNVAATFGCFAYAQLGDDRIRLHFENVEKDDTSPLGVERRDRRLAELAALFDYVKRTSRTPPRVIGASWLYNLDAYRRLFPKAYVSTAHVIHDRYQHMPLWGQSVDRRGEVKESVARELLDRLGRQSSLEGLEACFPFQVLALEALASEFYEFLRRLTHIAV